MNTDTKILNRIPETIYKKVVYTMTVHNLSLECKAGLISKNQLM